MPDSGLPAPRPIPRLVLGPLLRHVDPVSATVWVETDRRCTVRVLDATAGTFEVAGHHYALVLIDGLAPGSVTPYEVQLDEVTAWPPQHSPYPPSRIRTPGRPGPFRIAFGSCRYATPAAVDARDGIAPDALDSYARRLMALAEDEWPDALVLLGDQVYADETTPLTRTWLATRRDVSRPPYTQVADYEEYTRLYLESWTDAEVRWLLSTVPSSMIFDDHEVIDDWNTSAAWRATVQATGLVARAGSPAGWSATSSTSTWATSPPTSWPATRPGWPCRTPAARAPTPSRCCGRWPNGPTPIRRPPAGPSSGTWTARGW